jgi:protein SDA1
LFNLSNLQDKLKREHSLYKEEFHKILEYFNRKFQIFLKAPNKRTRGMKEMFNFFAQVGHIYPNEIAFIPLTLMNLIENNYSFIQSELRIAIVENLSLLRKKDLLTALE